MQLSSLFIQVQLRKDAMLFRGNDGKHIETRFTETQRPDFLQYILVRNSML